MKFFCELSGPFYLINFTCPCFPALAMTGRKTNEFCTYLLENCPESNSRKIICKQRHESKERSLTSIRHFNNLANLLSSVNVCMPVSKHFLHCY